jgi:polar amino acid transport system substrate-binding protein
LRVAVAAWSAIVVLACSPLGAGRPPLPAPPHPALLGPTVAAIGRAGALRVASDLSYPPLAFRADSFPEGFEIDLAGLLAAALGVRLEVIDTPRAAMRPGFADADLLISQWTAAEAPGLPSPAYYVLRQGILWGGGEKPGPDASLAGVRLAVAARSRGQAVAARLGLAPAVVAYQPIEALRAVSRGQAQAALADLPLVVDYARTHRGLSASTGGWDDSPLVVVVRADAPDLLAFTSAAIRELEETGGLTRLRQRWHL